MMGDAAPPPPPPPGGKVQKSYFDVLGICCPSEVPLVERLLEPLPGVRKVTVIVPSRTVIVLHDADATSPAQIVKVLNQAKLDASVRAYGSGTEKITNKWPSPYVLLCGACLLVSLFEHFWRPLKWFALGAVAAGILPILQRSFAAARRLTLDVNILMLIAVSGAIALKDYSEAGFIVFLFTTAEWLETRASHKATAGMSSLMSMTPQKAVLAETGQVIAAQDVKVNTIIAVKAGEIIPIDGVVVDGRSEVDESTLTGESFPVAKQPESQVWAGTLNIDGYIAVRTTAMADNSAVAKMARLVEEAQNSRSNTQRLIDTCAKYYTPVPDMEDMKGVTVGYIACKKELIGVFTLSDSCRTGSAEAIKELRLLGIKSVMLTGDSSAVAAYAQEQLGNILDEVHSELLPEDKVRIVDELKAKHGPTLMIGDGMNDAPALAKADVGVSMGVSGSAVAMETSHITLMSNDIRRIPKAVQLARRTHRTIIVNIIFSVITKLAIVGLAIGGHPLIWAAVLADVGTCLLVIMYSMLLLRSKSGQKAKKCCASSQHGSHAKKHCVSGHCTDGPCKSSTGSCKESSSGKHGCHDHGHSHSHCKEPSNQQPTEKHACHDHDHSYSHCKEPSNQVVTENHACHDHGHTHNHRKEPGNQVLIENHGCHDHGHTHDHCHDNEHSHCKEAHALQHSDSNGACHEHEHSHCEDHNHSHAAGEHEHSHCEEHNHSHPTVEHACHDHDHEHEHHCHGEQPSAHVADTHHCHDHEHEHDHGEIEESEKDCRAEVQHHHSHCCHEPHGQEKKLIAAEPVQEVAISISSLPDENHEQHNQCSHRSSDEHKVADCTNHLKAKDCVPPPADRLSKNCCSVTSSNKECGSKGKDVCSSWQAVCAGETSRCCRSYVKCPRTTSSCCSHTMLKLPEIVVE